AGMGPQDQEESCVYPNLGPFTSEIKAKVKQFVEERTEPSLWIFVIVGAVTTVSVLGVVVLLLYRRYKKSRQQRDLVSLGGTMGLRGQDNAS
ncbi:hypothetical protein XENORESO_011324, partial [Xenotaenia resolanae]